MHGFRDSDLIFGINPDYNYMYMIYAGGGGGANTKEVENCVVFYIEI